MNLPLPATRSHKVCPTCDTVFPALKWQKYCSPPCRPTVQRPQWDSDRSIDTATKGSIGELAVSVDLMQKGYTVFRALSPSAFCDLIAIRLDSALYIEVRTGFTLEGRLYFPKNHQDGVNCFAVRDRTTGALSYFTTGTWSSLAI